MKKLLALTVALCLFFMSSAFAEYIASDGTPLQLEDFTLKPDAGMLCSVPGENVPGQACLSVFPFIDSGDVSSNFNMYQLPGLEDYTTTDAINQLAQNGKQRYLDSLKDLNATINFIEFKDAVECTISGIPCIYYDYTVDYTYYGQQVIERARRLYFSEKAYCIILNSDSEETIVKMTELLDAILTWN